MDPYEILKRPIVTEKSSFQSDNLNRYTFEVDPRANKRQIKETHALFPCYNRAAPGNRLNEFVGPDLYSPDLLNENRMLLSVNLNAERRAGKIGKKRVTPSHESLDILSAVL